MFLQANPYTAVASRSVCVSFHRLCDINARTLFTICRYSRRSTLQRGERKSVLLLLLFYFFLRYQVFYVLPFLHERFHRICCDRRRTFLKNRDVLRVRCCFCSMARTGQCLVFCVSYIKRQHLVIAKSRSDWVDRLIISRNSASGSPAH